MNKENLIELLRWYDDHNGYFNEIGADYDRVCLEAYKQFNFLNLAVVRESIPVHDIRNKLSPMCNLISMIGEPDFEKYMPAEIEKCKKAINYLANREVYSL
jgi:hypothetical protein